jgi:hypothetical protein
VAPRGFSFDHLLERYREMGLVKARGKQRTDSTRILAVVRGLNRLELVGETMRHALDVLSTGSLPSACNSTPILSGLGVTCEGSTTTGCPRARRNARPRPRR